MRRLGPVAKAAEQSARITQVRYAGKVVRKFWLEQHHRDPCKAEVRVHKFGFVVWYKPEWEEWQILVSGEEAKRFIKESEQ